MSTSSSQPLTSSDDRSSEVKVTEPVTSTVTETSISPRSTRKKKSPAKKRKSPKMSRLMKLAAPNAAVIESILLVNGMTAEGETPEGVTCSITIIDTGNVEYNVMNDVLMNKLLARGGEVERIQPITLVGYENTSMNVDKLTNIDKLTLKFAEGAKTFPNVDFLVIPANGNPQAEMIMSNRFLRERCKYNVIRELSKHIGTVLGFDSEEAATVSENPETPTDGEGTEEGPTSEFSFTPDEVETLCEGDSSDPSDMKYLLAQCSVQNSVNSDSKNKSHSEILGSVAETTTIPIVAKGSNEETTNAKMQVTVEIGDCDNISISVIQRGIVVDTPEGRYKVVRGANDGSNAACNISPCAVKEDLEGGQPPTLPHCCNMSERTNSMRADEASLLCRDGEGLTSESKSSLPHLPLEPATKRYYLPVEVRFPRNQYNLDHLDRRDPMLKIGEYVGVSQVPAPQTLDITEDVGPEGMRAYTRRMLIRKIQLYRVAARGQISRARVQEQADNVEIEKKTLLAMPTVLEYLKQFKDDNNFGVDEHDNTVKANPKAFDFAQPQTDEEVDEFIHERLKESQENCSLTPDEYEPLVKLVEAKREALRIRLGRDHAAKVEPLRIKIRDGAVPKKMRNSGMNPEAKLQMNSQVDQLEKINLVYRNKNARWVAIARMVAKPGGAPGELRMIIDYRYLNSLTEPIQGPMPILEDEIKKCQGAKYFMTFDFLKGFFQIPIHPESQHYFSFMTDKGVYTPTRIPQGAVDSPIYFHACIAEIFDDLISENKMLLWIDDGVIFAKTWEEFLALMERVFNKCIEYDLKLNIRKTCLANTSATWCGRVINGEGAKLQARNTETFLKMSEPKLAGELSQFLQGINWMRNSLMVNGANDSFASHSSILWKMLETVYVKAKSRKRNRFKNIRLDELGWNTEHVIAFNAIKRMLAECQTNAFPVPGARICLFTDASDKFHAAILTQVLHWDDSKHVSEQQHIPMATLSGEFKNSEVRWRINEKEAYPIIKALEEWEYLLLCPQGFDIYGDHENLVKLFHPDKTPKPHSKATELRVYNWLYLLGQFKVNRMEHIPGELNIWSDMLSRWANPAASNPTVSTVYTVKPANKRGKTPVISGGKRKRGDQYSQARIRQKYLQIKYDYGNPNTEMPKPEVIKVAQSREHLSRGERKFHDDNIERFTTNEDGVLLYDGKFWIPHENIELMTRVSIGAHCGLEEGHSEPGHRGSRVTLQYCTEYFWWYRMDEFVNKFCQSCLSCLKDKHSNDIIPRKLGTSLHARQRGEVLCFDYLYIGPVKETDPHQFEYVLVLKDEYSGYVELVPCTAPNSDQAAEAIKWWIARFTKPKWLVSDRGSHFKCKVIENLAKYFDIKHHFTLAYCPWSNGTVERVNRDIKALLKILQRECKTAAYLWPYMLPSVMSVINSTPSERLGGLAPKEVYMGLPKYNPFTVLYSQNLNDVAEMPLDVAEFQNSVDTLRESLDQMHAHIERTKEVRQAQNQDQSDTNRARIRRAAELGKRVRDLKGTDLIPNFSPGDYVLVAIPKTTKQHKLHAVWRGPYRIVRAVTDYVYEVEHLVTNDVTECHIARMKFYADSELDVDVPALKDEITREKSVFSNYDVENFVDHKYDRERMEYVVLVRWHGFSEAENTWESITEIYEQVPATLLKYLREQPQTEMVVEMLDIINPQ